MTQNSTTKTFGTFGSQKLVLWVHVSPFSKAGLFHVNQRGFLGFAIHLQKVIDFFTTHRRLQRWYQTKQKKIKPRNLASLTTSGFFFMFLLVSSGYFKGAQWTPSSFQVVSVSDLDTLSPYKDQHHSIPPSSWPPPLQFHDHGMGGRMMLMISRSCVLNVGIPSFPWKDLCVCVVWFSGNCSREVSMLKLSSWKALLERYRKKAKLEFKKTPCFPHIAFEKMPQSGQNSVPSWKFESCLLSVVRSKTAVWCFPELLPVAVSSSDVEEPMASAGGRLWMKYCTRWN